MMVSGMWLLAGVVIGMILMAFLAIGTYQRGYDAGFFLRKPWRAELLARRQGVIDAFARERKFARTHPAATPVRAAAPSRVASASPAAASSG